MKTLKIILMLTGLLLLSATSLADNSSRTSFETVETLEAINFAANTMVIGGRQFHMAHNIEWLGLPPEDKPSDIIPRIVPTKVGYKLSQDAKGKTTVAAVWIFSGAGR